MLIAVSMGAGSGVGAPAVTQAKDEPGRMALEERALMNSGATNSLFIRFAPMLFVLLWSTGYVGARFALPFVEPLTFTALRFSIVVVVLAIILVLSGRRLPRSLRMWGHLAISGVLIHAFFIGGVFSAIDIGVDIGVAALILGVQPLLTAVLVAPVLGERLSARQWLGFSLGFFGLALVVMKAISTGALSFAGISGCVVGLIGITFGSVYQKRFVVGIDLIAGSCVQFAAALVPCAIYALAFESGAIEWTMSLILALVWLCFGLSIGAISILLVLIRRGAASQVSALFYLVPPITALQGYWLFDQSLSSLQLIGMVLAACGVALVTVTKAADN